MASPQPIVSTSWPDHLVPICTDGRANKPFPYVLDVAHLLDYGMLPYYPVPVPVVPALSPFVEARRSSVAPSASSRRRSTFVAFGDASNQNTTEATSLSAAGGQEGSSPLGKPAAGTSPVGTAQHYEMNLQPVGTLLLMGASLQAPLTNYRPTEGGEPPLNAAGRTLSDDERFYSLRLPNQNILLKPRSTAQQQLMVDQLSQWIRVANQQMFNSRLVIVKAEFAALPMRASSASTTGHLHTSSDTADEVRHLQEQRAHKDDMDFCRMLTAATFSLGSFANAREAVGERGVPEDVTQKQIALPSASGNDSDSDGVALKKKFVTLLLPFAFGSLERIAVAVKHESHGWYVPALKSGLPLMQLVAQHDASRAPFVMELAPLHGHDGSVQGSKLKGKGGSRRSAGTVASPTSRVRVVCRLSWYADENWVLRVMLRASNLLRRDFCLADPVCFVGTKPADATAQNGQPSGSPANSSSTAPPQYKFITEAYRNKLDAEFAPLHFALPMDIPTGARSATMVDFMTGSSTADGANGEDKPTSSASQRGKERLLKSQLFPPSVLPPIPAPPVTLADMQTEQQQLQASVSTMHRFGDDALWPYIQSNESLNFEMVDAFFDADRRETLPSLVGSVTIPVQDLLALERRCAAIAALAAQRAQQKHGGTPASVPTVMVSPPPNPPPSGAASCSGRRTSKQNSPIPQEILPSSAGKVAGSPADFSSIRHELIAARFPLATNLAGNVNITPATPTSTVERLRQRQKRRFPVPLSRFVFSNASEVTMQENAQVLNRANAARNPEITLLSVTKKLRPSFLGFVEGGQWDMSSLIVLDCTHNAIWSHFNSFLPNDMPDSSKAPSGPAGGGGGAAVPSGAPDNKGKNVYETIIMAINRLLVPFLTRGGSDVLAVTTASGSSANITVGDDAMPTSVSTLHSHTEGFGVHVDETSITSRKIDVSAAFTSGDGTGSPVRRNSTVGGGASARRMSSFSSTAYGDDQTPLLLPTDPDDDGGSLSVMDASLTPSPIATSGSSGRSLQHVFSAIRDWSGEGSLPAYKAKFEGIVVKARAAAGMPVVSLDGVDRAIQELMQNTPGSDAGTQGGDASSPTRKLQTTRSQLQPPPTSKLSRGSISLCSIMKRCMLRCVALSNARKQTAARVDQMMQDGTHSHHSNVSCFGRQVFHVVTIVLHSDVADAVECASLLSRWQSRPVFFIFIFLDDAAPSVLCGIPNCVTVDMSCCSKLQQQELRAGLGSALEVPLSASAHRGSRGRPSTAAGQSHSNKESKTPCMENYEVPLLAVHRQLRSLEFAISRIPLAFLSFARMAGIQLLQPTEASEAPSKSSHPPENRDIQLSSHPPTETSSSVVRRLSRPISRDDVRDEQMTAALQSEAAFESAKEKFFNAFKLKAKPQSVPQAADRQKSAAALVAVHPSAAPILTTGSPVVQSSGVVGAQGGGAEGVAALRPTFTGDIVVTDSSGVPVRSGTNSALASSEEVSSSALVVPEKPKDLRAAAVALFDVFMDDDQLREWEVDPQHLRPKMQAVALQHKAPSPGATASNDTLGPLIDDSLIRLHLKRIQSLGSNGTPQSPSKQNKGSTQESAASPPPVEEDVDETPTLSQKQADPSQPVKVFMRKTKQDGHLKEIGLRIGSVESFASKLPAPPPQPAGPAGRRNSQQGSPTTARNANRRVSESPFSTASLEKRMLENARAAAAGEAPDSDAPQRPLTARQMAAKREQEETERAVNWALRKLLKKTSQHLKRPHIHNRILQSNQTLQKRRQSLQQDFGEDHNDQMDDATSQSSFSSSTRHRQPSSGFEFGDADCDASARLEDDVMPYTEYRVRGVMRGVAARHLGLITDSLRRKDEALKGYPRHRPSSASTALFQGREALAPASTVTPSGARKPNASSNSKQRGDDEDGDDDDDVRFQQLSLEKRSRLQSLLASEARSYGGPKLNEEQIFEQEAEFDRRRLKEQRKRETERIEEAYRQQKQRDMFDKNRGKLRQYISTNTAKDETGESDVDGV